MRYVGKKVLSLALAVVVCFTLTVPALAELPEFEMKMNNVLQYNGTGGHIIIPDGVTKLNLTYRKSGARENITGVTIPESVTEIASLAGTGITSLTIPGNVKKIGSRAFSYSRSLTNLTLEEGIQEIDDAAFTICTALTSVNIPDSVTNLGGSVFSQCSSLKSAVLPSGITKVSSGLFSLCESLTNVTIPENVTLIESSAFLGCSSLAEITIPGKVTDIWDYAFQNCTSLTRITIPASVTYIGQNTFDGCTSLTDVYYGGTEEQWNNVTIHYIGNEVLRQREQGAEDEEGNVIDNTGKKLATIHFLGSTSEPPVDLDPTKGVSAAPTNDKLSVDGKEAAPAAYKINGANYFKLRDVAMMLSGTESQFSIKHDGEKNVIMITTGQPYAPIGGELGDPPTQSSTANPSNDAVYINGEKVELTAYKIDGANYYGVRELGKALGFNVGWSPDRGMFIESDKPYTDAD